MDKFSDAPSSKPYFELSGSKFEMQYQRNVLLHFIHEKGLDEQFIAYLDFLAPEDEYEVRTIKRTRKVNAG